MKRKLYLTNTILLALFVLFSVGKVPSAYASTVATNEGFAKGGQHFLVIREDGSLWAWGNNRNGQLGDGTTIDRTSLNPVKIMENVMSVTAGNNYSMAITNEGILFAWGSNEHGKLGNGTVINQPSPVRILDNAKYASAGEASSFAIKDDGSLWAWGYNGGALGDGSSTNRHSPVKIMDNVKTAYIGSSFNSWAIKTDGSLWVWHLGIGVPDFAKSGAFSNIPVKVLEGVASADINILSYMIVYQNGNLHSAGRNSEGQLGDGTGVDQSNLVWIMSDVISVKQTGSGSTYVIKNDNSMWGWGASISIISGDYTAGITYSPKKLLDNIAEIVDAGSMRIILLKTDGTLWEYGFSGGKQIMDNIPLSAPIAVSPPQTTPTNPNMPSTGQPSSWAADAVRAGIAAEIVHPSLRSNYQQPTTRAEFCSLAVALYENTKGEIMGRSTFSDTNDINVQKAASIGVVGGVGNNLFDPDTQLTREQAAAMLARLADAIGKPFPKYAATFSDNSAISSWALEAVGQVQEAGIMGGVGDNRFAPKDPYTREQSIVTIMRLFDVVT